MAVANLLSPAWSGRRVPGVHGPEDLTFDEVAETVGTATGRRIRAEHVSDDDLRAGLRAAGLSDGQVEGFVGMSRGLRDAFRPEPPRSVLTTTPTSLRSWAVEHLRPRLRSRETAPPTRGRAERSGGPARARGRGVLRTRMTG